MTLNSVIGREIRIVGYNHEMRPADCELYCDQVLRNIQGRFFHVIDYDPTDNMIAIRVDEVLWLHPGEYIFTIRNLFE